MNLAHGFQDPVEVMRFGGGYLYCQSHLIGPKSCISDEDLTSKLDAKYTLDFRDQILLMMMMTVVAMMVLMIMMKLMFYINCELYEVNIFSFTGCTITKEAFWHSCGE